MQDAQDAEEKEAAEESKTAREAARQGKKVEKEQSALQKQQFVSGKLAVLRPALETAEQVVTVGPTSTAGWEGAAQSAHGALVTAMDGCRVNMGPDFKRAREEISRLDEFRKKHKGTHKAADQKHAVAVAGFTGQVMAMLQKQANANSYDAAGWETQVSALVESMAAKF